MSESSKLSSGSPTPIPLTINCWWRTVVILLGLAALGAGGLAVFVTRLEAGPVALLAVGFLFLIIGISGRLPNRLKVGENEAEWNAVAQAFEQVVRAVPPDKLPEVKDAVEDLALESPNVGRYVQRRVGAEIILLSRLHYWTERLGLSYGEEVHVNGARPDAVIVGPNGQKIWTIAHTNNVRAWQLEAAKNLLRQIKETNPSFAGMLIIAPAGREYTRTIETPAGPIYIATVAKGEESLEIGAALTSAFALDN